MDLRGAAQLLFTGWGGLRQAAADGVLPTSCIERAPPALFVLCKRSVTAFDGLYRRQTPEHSSANAMPRQAPAFGHLEFSHSGFVVCLDSRAYSNIMCDFFAAGAGLQRSHQAADGFHDDAGPARRGGVQSLGRVGGGHAGHVQQRNDIQPAGHPVPQTGAPGLRSRALRRLDPRTELVHGAVDTARTLIPLHFAARLSDGVVARRHHVPRLMHSINQF